MPSTTKSMTTTPPTAAPTSQPLGECIFHQDGAQAHKAREATLLLVCDFKKCSPADSAVNCSYSIESRFAEYHFAESQFPKTRVIYLFS